MRRLRGGNARKQKRQLSDATLRSVIGEADDGAATLGPDGLSGDEVLSDELFAEEVEEAAEQARQPVHEQGLAPINGFVFSRYVLGTATCSTCHCELIYYQDRAVLSEGFTMRCRVCQTVQTLTVREE